MYRLDNRFAQHPLTVTVVGCGGTGGFVTEGLCRLLPPEADLVLVDHDRVEERNLGRQSFVWQDVGRFKSQALAQRFACRYGRPVAYSVLPVAMTGIKVPGLVIGCVDNGPARRDIASALRVAGARSPIAVAHFWWIDAGNGENYGQVLIGNSSLGDPAFSTNDKLCLTLPLPTIQRPEILAQRKRRGCGEAVEAGEQGPVINQVMAGLVVEVARRLIEGTCPWAQLYLDLEAGTLTPVPATPSVVDKITRQPRKKGGGS
jgi:PRTRC genetic system ThiF family protein